MNIIKMAFSPRLMYRFDAIPNSLRFFIKYDKIILSQKGRILYRREIAMRSWLSQILEFVIKRSMNEGSVVLR